MIAKADIAEAVGVALARILKVARNHNIRICLYIDGKSHDITDCDEVTFIAGLLETDGTQGGN